MNDHWLYLKTCVMCIALVVVVPFLVFSLTYFNEQTISSYWFVNVHNRLPYSRRNSFIFFKYANQINISILKKNGCCHSFDALIKRTGKSELELTRYFVWGDWAWRTDRGGKKRSLLMWFTNHYYEHLFRGIMEVWIDRHILYREIISIRFLDVILYISIDTIIL